jgi:NitT/TauT family transport system substrate-binding protein
MIRRAQVLGSLAAAALALPARRAHAQTAPIRLGVAANDTYAETLFAQDQGFFERAGINVELAMFTNAPAMVAAAAGNALDVGVADVIQIGNAVIRGVPLAAIASGALYQPSNPTAMLCVAKDSPIRAARDLNGKTVAVVSLGAFGAISIQEWLRTNGAAAESVKLTEMPFAPMAAALGRGTVAAALIGEPFLSAAGSDVRALADTYPTIANAFYIAVSFAPREWVGRNRETARLFVRAVYDAGRWANTHHDESAVILSKYAKLDVERIRTMRRAFFATTPLDVRLMQPVLDIGLTYQFMTKPLQAAAMIAAV